MEELEAQALLPKMVRGHVHWALGHQGCHLKATCLNGPQSLPVSCHHAKGWVGVLAGGGEPHVLLWAQNHLSQDAQPQESSGSEPGLCSDHLMPCSQQFCTVDADSLGLHRGAVVDRAPEGNRSSGLRALNRHEKGLQPCPSPQHFPGQQGMAHSPAAATWPLVPSQAGPQEGMIQGA